MIITNYFANYNQLTLKYDKEFKTNFYSNKSINLSA